MSDASGTARSRVYRQLRKGFHHFSGMMNFHLGDTLLREMGVDAIQVDLEEETRRGGPYFLPMSQERMDSLGWRPEFCIEFDDDRTIADRHWYDAYQTHAAFRDQLRHPDDVSTWEAAGALQGTCWQPRDRRSTYQNLLCELDIDPDPSDPKRQCRSNVSHHFVAEGFPHRSIVALAGVPNVKGLVRSEMMTVTGMMISAMREKEKKDITIVPLVLVSIIGRFARVIQAHVSLEEERLKVRYSQLYEFDNCSQHQMDLFLRWILSSPLLEPKPQPEAQEPPSKQKGVTAPQTTVCTTKGNEFETDSSRNFVEAIRIAA